MLAGLLFATRDALDRPDALAATLPFGGMTLVEFQARMLVGAGVSQLILVVTRLTPELLGAVNRIGRRGVPVDVVRNAEEAAAKLHPLARVLMLADGLITADAVVGEVAHEGVDALMTVDAAGAPASFERLGGNQAWAGIARFDSRRLGEAIALPRDYDLQSALVRLVSQAGAEHVPLPERALSFGHGVELRASTLAERSRSVLAALVEQRSAWFDRYLVGPVARRALPALVEKGTVAALPIAAAGAAGALGLVAIGLGWAATGLVLVVLAGIALAVGGTLAQLRDEPRLAKGEQAVTAALAAAAVLLLGYAADVARGEGATGLALGAALVGFAAIGERAASGTVRRRWWGSPAAYPLVLLPFTLLAWPLIGLVVGASYAAATLTSAVEGLRRRSLG